MLAAEKEQGGQAGERARWSSSQNSKGLEQAAAGNGQEGFAQVS